MGNNIFVLPIEKWRIINKIKFEYEINAQIFYGTVVYLRKFSECYKMQTPPVDNDIERIKRYMVGIPQEEYPNDELDDVIIKGLSAQLNVVHINSSLLIVNTDADDIMKYKNGHLQKVDLIIGPDWASLPLSILPFYEGIQDIAVALDCNMLFGTNDYALFPITCNAQFQISEWLDKESKMLDLLSSTYERIINYIY